MCCSLKHTLKCGIFTQKFFKQVWVSKGQQQEKWILQALQTSENFQFRTNIYKQASQKRPLLVTGRDKKSQSRAFPIRPEKNISMETQ